MTDTTEYENISEITPFKIREYILNECFERQWKNIPVAFSMCDYLYQLYKVISNDYSNYYFVNGEVRGACAHYLSLDDHFGFKFKALDTLSENLGASINSAFTNALMQTKFKYTDVSNAGNALSVAMGLAWGTHKKVLCNISDEYFLKENCLSALQYLFNCAYRFPNLFLTINACTYKDNLALENIISSLYKTTDLKTFFIDGHEWKLSLYNEFIKDNSEKPKVIVFNTELGRGIDEFERYPVGYSNKVIPSLDALKHYQEILRIQYEYSMNKGEML